MELEGALRVGLCVGAGRIEQIRITSTRPDAARSLLQGRTRDEIRVALPLLFSICGRSHAVAAELACAAAAGEAPTDAALERCRAEVSAEVVRECSWRILLDWPRWIGEAPGAEAVAAARSLQNSHARVTVPADPGAGALAAAAFGVSSDKWLEERPVGELDRWIEAGETAAARFLRRTRDEDGAVGAGGDAPAAPVPFLDGCGRAAAMVELWAACEADPQFTRRPTWRGAPAETGALARLCHDPLIAELTRRSPSRVFARFVARLREFALLLAGRALPALGAQAVPRGGIAWVENARGLLVHHVRLEAGRATMYRIVAPTEWNFHPDGALASALIRASANDVDALRQRVVRTARSLDPCVACRVEFENA